MKQTILCLNGGSSSLKFAVYGMSAAAEERLLFGAAEGIAAANSRFWLRDSQERVVFDRVQGFSDHARAVAGILAALHEQGIAALSAAGHRIVHGGRYFRDPQIADAQVRRKLLELVPLAALHLPSQIALLEAVAAQFPDLPQVVSFDTAFHAGIPEIARRFAMPRTFWDEGVMRFGFHGLSYEYVVGKLGADLGSRAIIAHLGNGASMVALKDRRPLDTSMGLTPTGGFMMGTRSGDLDPGVLFYLQRQGYTTDQLEELLDRQSGLLGVSGRSKDMKDLLDARKDDPASALAVAMFCYQVRKFIGAYAAVLNGLDSLVFTGGIGERSAEVRAGICSGMDFLGIGLDDERNQQHQAVISPEGSRCSVRVAETDEDLMIARHTATLMSGLIKTKSSSS
jgi:acetate kinase